MLLVRNNARPLRIRLSPLSRQEARLRLLLSLGEHAGAARLMTTALHIGLAQLAVGGEE